MKKENLFSNERQLTRIQISKIFGGTEASYKDGNNCTTWQDYKTGAELSEDCNGLNSKDCGSIDDPGNGDIIIRDTTTDNRMGL